MSHSAAVGNDVHLESRCNVAVVKMWVLNKLGTCPAILRMHLRVDVGLNGDVGTN